MWRLIVRLAAVVIFITELVSVGELTSFVPVGPALPPLLKSRVLSSPLLLPAGLARFRAVASPSALPVCRTSNERLFAAQARVSGCGSHGNLQCLVDPTKLGCTHPFRWLPLGAVESACGWCREYLWERDRVEIAFFDLELGWEARFIRPNPVGARSPGPLLATAWICSVKLSSCAGAAYRKPGRCAVTSMAYCPLPVRVLGAAFRLAVPRR